MEKARQLDVIAARAVTPGRVTASPFGPADEIGMLNLMTDESRAAAWTAADPTSIYDLSVDYHVGMPSWAGLGDPTYQIWMSHTPVGSVNEDVLNLGEEQNRHVTYSGDCIAMYTHTGTHLDALNHFGLDGEVWNNVRADRDLGSRHWLKNGADRHPPVIARGVLLDVAAAAGVDVLPDSHRITAEELQEVMDRQGSHIQVGDVVLIRTGRMHLWHDGSRYLHNEAGLDRGAAELLAEAGAMIIGADNVALEVMPSVDPTNWHPVHTYLLGECGIPIMENVYLEDIAAAQLWEFVLVGAGLRLRGATASPMRPLAFPLLRDATIAGNE
ncbi:MULTISPECIES: cyclase family protein [unclassified Streptomyces]|uniref:cyclase family protein n=1 Tax=unclassified Streptomyces TaxID=2593676 RepID=UPI002DDA217C|nr:MULTISPECIES: cyclase family protein [unclassified Streptomyces]WSA05032.1 cyclase family protein [Streptomyces sp. NBC_00841]WSJ91949.1 cyclase family protein [Streptomyces sp. NBC_01320]WSK01138.1 cyclase family protein [Streptomyces sp. NBC_01320]